MSVQQMQVDRFMTPCPHCIEAEAALIDAHKLMREHQIRHLPVIKDGELVGVVSSRDLHMLDAFNAVSLADERVLRAMTPDPYVVEPTDSLRNVVMTMRDRKIGSAIVASDGEVLGILTTIDAMAALLDRLSVSKPR